jgi:aminoglycoside phosphotransferase (APT) family kinase protein
MTKATLAHALECLQLEMRTDAVEITGASGAGVHRVRVGGEDAVLKVTGPGPTRELARRELTFYRSMADGMPISTPRLLRSLDDEQVTALVLTAHRSSPPAVEWSRTAWLDLARQLATLHALPIPSGNHWLGTSWLGQALERPRSDVAEGYWFKTSAADSARVALSDIGELAEALRFTGDCFVHGDCHVENLLREGDDLVWADWQSVGVGSPAGELAFLWSRASADGADVPYDAMLDVYLSGADSLQMRRALVAAELGILLFGWPEHAAYSGPVVQDRLARRLVQLTDRWLSGTT